MSGPTVTFKRLNEIEGLEAFDDYAIDIDGNLWSFKYKKPRKLRPGWAKKRGSYLFVRLSDKKGNIQNFYIHNLVCRAFLPNHCNSRTIRYKDGNTANNAVTNIEWVGKKTENGVHESDTIKLNKELSDYIKLVHFAAIKKEIPVPNTYEFFHHILNESLNDYISRCGLKKVMYQLEQLL